MTEGTFESRPVQMSDPPPIHSNSISVSPGVSGENVQIVKYYYSAPNPRPINPPSHLAFVRPVQPAMIINGKVRSPGSTTVFYRTVPPRSVQFIQRPVILQSPPRFIPQRPLAMRVIQPVGVCPPTIRISPMKPTVFPVSKKEVNPPKEYPGDPKDIFEASLERPARLTAIKWRKYKEEYKPPDPESKIKVMKPWDAHYQPASNKQRAARTVISKEESDGNGNVRQATSISLNSNMGVGGGPLMEKNSANDFKKKKRYRRSSGSEPRRKRPKLSSESQENRIPYVKSESEIVESDDVKDEDSFKEKKFKKSKYSERIFKERTTKAEFGLTIGKKGISPEDLAYMQIASDIMLDRAENEQLREEDLGLPHYKSFTTHVDAILRDLTFDIPGLDKKTKNYDFKKSTEHALRRAAMNIPMVDQLRKPKILDSGSKIFFNDPELVDIFPNQSGCARSEPYKKKDFGSMVKIGGRHFMPLTEEDEIHVKTASERQKQERMRTRHILTQLQNEAPELARLDIFRPPAVPHGLKMVKCARSPIHGIGLYALEDIEPEQAIIEYIGEKIRHAIADDREKKYEKQGIGSSYMFKLDDNWVIDATKMGNMARFINHCCTPNCCARIESRKGTKRIMIYSKTFIAKGEELTYDYKFPLEETKIQCHCGSLNCRKYLN